MLASLAVNGLHEKATLLTHPVLMASFCGFHSTVLTIVSDTHNQAVAKAKARMHGVAYYIAHSMLARPTVHAVAVA